VSISDMKRGILVWRDLVITAQKDMYLEMEIRNI
jgi:hypothetical protein